MRVCIISFSSRANGNCAAISEFVKTCYGDSAEVYRFSDFSVRPCGECDYECFGPERGCPASGDRENVLLEAVIECDLAYFVVPNYCDYPCANYFAFNERGQYYFSEHPDRMADYERTAKKFIVVSNTEKENFRKAFSYQSKGAPDILFLRAADFGKVSIAGDLLASTQAKAAVAGFVSKPPFGPR